MEGAHDLGGLDGFGPVVTADAELTHHEAWELRAQALGIIGIKGSMRGWIERLDPATYLASSYYARWLQAAEVAAVAQELVTPETLARWTAALTAGAQPPVTVDEVRRRRIDGLMTTPEPLADAAAPRFTVGAAVVVRRWRDPDHHHRCPRYVRGVRGVVETVCGDERVPGREHELAPTYTVAFSSTDLWGAGDEPPFVVHVDLCEEYLLADGEADAR